MANVDTAPASGPPPASRPPLRVGALISESFAILFRRFWLFLLLGLLVILGYFLVVVLVFGLGVAGAVGVGGLLEGGGTTFLPSAGMSLVAVLLLLGFLLAATFTQAYQTAAGYNEFHGDRRGWGYYFQVGWRRMVPLFVVYLVSLIVIGLAFFGVTTLLAAIGAPGWLIVVIAGLGFIGVLLFFSLAVPAVVVERRWFSAFSRAWELSRDYRGPIIGFLLALIAIALGIAFLVGALVTGLATASNSPTAGVFAILLQIVNLALQILITALFLIGYAVLFSRLRNIKEGVRPDDVAATFD